MKAKERKREKNATKSGKEGSAVANGPAYETVGGQKETYEDISPDKVCDDHIGGSIKGTGSKEEKIRIRRERKMKYPNFTDLLLTIGVFIVSLVLAGILMAALSIFNMEKELVTAIIYPVQFVPVIVFLYYYRRHRGDSSPGARFAPRSVNLTLTLWGILLMLVTSVVIEPLLSLFPDRYFETVEQNIGRGGWAILTVTLVAPVLEEILFRGQILRAVKGKYGSFWALIISSFLFGLIHGIPPQMVNAFFLGLILGYIYIKTGSLFSVIIMHAVNNALAYVQMEVFEGVDSGATIRQSVGNDVTYFIIYGACLILFILGILGMVRTVKKQKAASLAEDGGPKCREFTGDDNNKAL